MRYQKEILLTQAILLTLLWLTNEYLAHLMTYILVPVFIAILIIALIAEKIERSKVPKYYFLMMGYMIAVFILTYILFNIIYGISGDWIKDPP